ncbi:MAG: alpha-glucoside transport system permease protein [Gaiellaceae bacterium]|jgi:alpha-glucoside transport system permease protein|nr:alpha-glucoside transport system permease protein [Gaiellaceae bacterium]
MPVAPPGGEPGVLRRNAVALGFLIPAAIILGVMIVYPTIYTIVRSFYGKDAHEGFLPSGQFAGIDNYKSLFTTNILVTAIKNSAIWILVAPALVTAIGLVFAVLTERIRWAVAFKTIVFMPMAISLFATGVIWHLMYIKDPSQGAVNAGIGALKSWWSPPGALSTASPSTAALTGSPQTGYVLHKAINPGTTALLGLTAIPPTDVPSSAKQAAAPTPKPNEVTGVVWRDFKPGGGTPGKVEPQELGLPGVKVNLIDSSGKSVQNATTDDTGAFTFNNVSGSNYKVGIAASTFAAPFGGISWLGSKLITPSVILAYIWVWAGFAMVVIGAGLAAISREVLEAARTDGATEWQVFRRITVPMLAPVLSVVFITMLINVLKVFDIIISIAPGSTQSDAAVIAVQMWRQSFGGVNDFGLGSAIAVFLFVLVIPVLLLNVRRFRREV